MDYSGNGYEILKSITDDSELFFERRVGSKHKSDIKRSYHTKLIILPLQKTDDLIINSELYDEERRTNCRLSDDVLRSLFFEILKNAVNNGKLEIKDDGKAEVTVALEYSIVHDKHCLILKNAIQKPLYKDYEWRLVKADSGSGLGLTAHVLKNFGIGDVFECCRKNEKEQWIYCVAIWIKGLTQRGN